ncbi:YihY/virulence factor BrkB family protein [Tissierella praeacuta]|uniref:YihY/virulence factor BrkB family protein n=1 Tax=Tissierella praeacuta TaxID=43131 RepID=UPI000ED55788|nr:YihY/virulence factor BrkB family protein [Tissierella praeacuta]MBU5255703.1 YihY/virulence factor BrkB family protein [Tissierella praeacuta]HAE91484.1 ribonuclease [Tissierella sp.]
MLNWLDRYDNKYARFLKELLFRMKDDSVTAIGAQLSYFLVLSAFPFLIFFLNILSYTPIAREDVLHSIITLLPLDTQRLISTLLIETIVTSNEALLSLSAITGIWAASKGIMALIRVLNKAYDVEETRSYLELRGIAILFTIALLVLLVMVLLTLVFGEVLGNRLFDFLGITKTFISFWKYFRVIISLCSMIFIFTLLYRFVPSIKNSNKISLKHSLPGAIFTSLGWIITSTIFSYYVNNFGNYGKTYGSLGGIIVLLIWLYISSIIIIMGGEINATLKFLDN